MAEWRKPERIAGLAAVLIALLAVAAPLAAPPPAPFPRVVPGIGSWPATPAAGNNTASYPATPQVQVSAANSVVVVEEAAGGNTTISAVGLYTAYLEDGVLYIHVNGGVVKVRIPHTVRSLQLNLVNTKASISTNATIRLKAVNSRITALIEATGNRSSSMRLLNSRVTLVVRHPGSGVRLKLSSMGGRITVEGDYSYQLSTGTVELGRGPYTLTIDASNSLVTARVAGQ